MNGDTIKVITIFTIVAILGVMLFWFTQYKPTQQCEAKTCPKNMSAILLNGHCICVIELK